MRPPRKEPTGSPPAYLVATGVRPFNLRRRRQAEVTAAVIPESSAAGVKDSCSTEYTVTRLPTRARTDTSTRERARPRAHTHTHTRNKHTHTHAQRKSARCVYRTYHTDKSTPNTWTHTNTHAHAGATTHTCARTRKCLIHIQRALRFVWEFLCLYAYISICVHTHTRICF